MDQELETSIGIQKEIIHPINHSIKTVAIIGCSHAGTLCAINLRHNDPTVRILVFEQNSEISFLQCGIHLAINKTCTDQTKMFYNSPQNLRKMNIEIYTASVVDSMDFKNQFVNALVHGERKQFQYSKAILACGSAPIIPPIIENIEYTKDTQKQLRQLKRILLCKNYSDSLRLAKLYQPKKVCIIGAGLIGMELAWSFSEVGSKVTVIDHGSRILQKYFDDEYTTILTDSCKDFKIEVIDTARVCKISESEVEVTIVIEQQLKSQVKTSQMQFDYLVLAAGFRPNTNFVRNHLKNVKNVIVTNQQQQTSIQNVYAIGDCSTTVSKLKGQKVYIPLTTVAMRQGLIASFDIAGVKLPNPGINGTTAIQIFDYSMASTGLQLEEAKQISDKMSKVIYSDYLYHRYCNKKVQKVVQKESLNKEFDLYGDIVRRLADQVVDSFEIDFEDQEDQIVSINIVFDMKTGRIYGNQSMGKQDITQQTNAISTAISQGMTIDEIAQIDFGGYCGEEKPWNALAVAAASKDLATVDFEYEE